MLWSILPTWSCSISSSSQTISEHAKHVSENSSTVFTVTEVSVGHCTGIVGRRVRCVGVETTPSDSDVSWGHKKRRIWENHGMQTTIHVSLCSLGKMCYVEIAAKSILNTEDQVLSEGLESKS
jgi:hypothetical protein